MSFICKILSSKETKLLCIQSLLNAFYLREVKYILSSFYMEETREQE